MLSFSSISSIFYLCDFVLKVFSDLKESAQFYSNKMFNKLLIENDIPTPKIIYSNNNLGILPASWIMWEWVPGEPSCEVELETERECNL